VETVVLTSLYYNPGAGVQTVDLNVHFEDPDCSSAVRMTYTLGAVDIILYEDTTPATVANFLAYVNGTGQGLMMALLSSWMKMPTPASGGEARLRRVSE
jgi:hypothetical protein